MGDGNIYMTFAVTKEPGAQPVFCKVERGQRYRRPETVKLCRRSMYRIDINIKPPQRLTLLKIDDKVIRVFELDRVNTSCAYRAYYLTKNVQPSARGDRSKLEIEMHILGTINFTTYLQVKYYKAHDRCHSEYGSRLHFIEFEYDKRNNEWKKLFRV